MRYIFETSLHGDLLVSPHTLITSFLKKEEENKNPHQPHLPQITSQGSFQAYTKTTLSLYHMPLARSSLSDPLSWSMLLNVSTQCLVKSVVITTAYHCHYILWLSLHTVTVNCDCQLIVTIYCDCQLWLSLHAVIVITSVTVNWLSLHTVTVNCECHNILWLSTDFHNILWLSTVIVNCDCHYMLWLSLHTVLVTISWQLLCLSLHFVIVTMWCYCDWVQPLIVTCYCILILSDGSVLLLEPLMFTTSCDIHYIMWYSLHPVEFTTSCDI